MSALWTQTPSGQKQIQRDQDAKAQRRQEKERLTRGKWITRAKERQKEKFSLRQSQNLGAASSLESFAQPRSKKSMQLNCFVPFRKGVRKVSKKRSAETRIYNRLRISFLRENPICQRRYCGAKSVCVHHWAGRRSNYLKVETWRASCIGCNDFAKNHPKEAREENWIAPIGVYLT